MRIVLLSLFISFGLAANAQQSCYRLFCYNVPDGWEKEEDSYRSYTYGGRMLGMQDAKYKNGWTGYGEMK